MGVIVYKTIFLGGINDSILLPVSLSKTPSNFKGYGCFGNLSAREIAKFSASSNGLDETTINSRIALTPLR